MSRVVLLVAAIAVAVVLDSGIAWAATIVGTNGDDTRTGTKTTTLCTGSTAMTP